MNEERVSHIEDLPHEIRRYNLLQAEYADYLRTTYANHETPLDFDAWLTTIHETNGS